MSRRAFRPTQGMTSPEIGPVLKTEKDHRLARKWNARLKREGLSTVTKREVTKRGHS